MDQKQLCDSMIEEKNKLINDFKQVNLEYFNQIGVSQTLLQGHYQIFKTYAKEE